MKQISLILISIAALSSFIFSQETRKKIAQPVLSQTVPGQQKLYNEIHQKDKTLFDAFNAQNINKLKAIFAPDLESYQDNDGLASYAQTIKDFEAMFRQPNKIHRELIEDSLEVYPIKNFGAIEAGAHKFCHIENGKEECGTFKFMHV